jgi:hypothetical protein
VNGLSVRKPATKRRLTLAALGLVSAIVATGAVLANSLDVPVMEAAGDGQMANCTSSAVTGLRAGGDGFLAVRTGPGSQYRKIDELRNGEVVVIFDIRDQWAGVVYRTANMRCSSRTARAVTYGNKGWVHTRWLKDVAG